MPSTAFGWFQGECDPRTPDPLARDFRVDAGLQQAGDVRMTPPMEGDRADARPSDHPGDILAEVLPRRMPVASASKIGADRRVVAAVRPVTLISRGDSPYTGSLSWTSRFATAFHSRISS